MRWLILLLLIQIVLSKPVSEYYKIYLEPSYVNSFNDRAFTLIVDNDYVKTAFIVIEAFSDSDNNIRAFVNNVECKNSYYVDKDAFKRGFIKVMIDCSNAIDNGGIYNVRITSSKPLYSAFAYAEISFEDNRIYINTGGTEYLPSESGRVFVRLLDSNSRPINHASCNTTIYYPNNTRFMDNQQMNFLEKGIYYYDFVVPSIEGNYITIFDCIFPSKIFFQNHTSIPEGPSYSSYFSFDNSNNLTINSALLEMKGYGGGADKWNVYFNDNLVGVCNASLYCSYNLSSDLFKISETQSYSLVATGGKVKVSWISLKVNYTYNNPLSIIRGQDEIHVSNNKIISYDIIDELLANKDILEQRFKSNHNFCVNDTLVHNITYEYCISGNCKEHSYLREEKCPYGCSYDRCNPNPAIRILLFIAIAIILPIIILKIIGIFI